MKKIQLYLQNGKHIMMNQVQYYFEYTLRLTERL
jgi:hypothetical protein